MTTYQGESAIFPPQILILFGIVSLLASPFLYYYDDYDNALLFCTGGVLNTLLGVWRLCVNQRDQWVVNLLCFFGALIISAEISASKAEKMNQSARKKIACGEVTSIHIIAGERAYRSTFDLSIADINEIIKFKYLPNAEQLKKYGSMICIEYSHNKKWADHPFIYQITENKKNF